MLRSRFLLKLYLGFGLAIFLATVVVAVFVSRRIEADAMADIEAALSNQALLVEELGGDLLVTADRATLQQRVTDLGRKLGSRLTLIDAAGTVLADSNESPELMENHGTRPEILDARQRGTGQVMRYSATLQTQMMYMARAVRSNGQLLGYARVALPLSAVDSRLDQLGRSIALGVLLATALALVFGLWLAQRISRPLRDMTQAAHDMAAGDYARRVRVTGRDEVAELSRAFDSMAEQLSQRMALLTDERNKLQAILSGMIEGVIAVSPEERILHMNEVAGRLLGADPAASIGKPIWEVTRIPGLAEVLSECLQGELELGREIRQTSPDGERVVDLYASPLPGNGNPGGAVLVLHEVTELRRLETVRQDFVANVSHELKTPLTAIRGLVETMEDDSAMPAETRNRFLAKIRNQADRLAAQVSDLLALSRMESGSAREQRETFDIREPAQSAASALAASAETLGVALSLELLTKPAFVLGEREALEQAIANLLDNAIKYTPQGGQVTLRIREQGREASVEIIDTGIGIEPQHQKRIFERFYRVDKARSRELGGTGLGLAIVKHAVQSQGGEVEVESRPGSGSTFRIRLPLAGRASNASQAPGRQGA